MKYSIFLCFALFACSSEPVSTPGDDNQNHEPETPSALFYSDGSGGGGFGCGVRTYMLHSDAGDRLINVPSRCDPSWRMKERFVLPHSLDHQPYER